MYVNVEIFNVQQRRINVVYFNIDIKRCYFQRRDSQRCFDVDQNMTICLVKRARKYFGALKKVIIKAEYAEIQV